MKSHVYFSLSVWRTWRWRRAGPVSVWRGWLADGVLGVPALSPARSEGGNFWPGLLVGGVVGGALAYIFAPQISRYLLGEEAQASGEGAVEETNTKLGAEIAALNSEIDKVKEKVREHERGDGTLPVGGCGVLVWLQERRAKAPCGDDAAHMQPSEARKSVQGEAVSRKPSRHAYKHMLPFRRC